MTATGVYHCYNMAKFRILAILIAAKKKGKYVTSAQIAQLTGMDLHNVRQNLTHYSKKKRYPILKRSEKKKGNEYLYVITETGEEIYEIMKNRAKSHMDLNFSHDYISYDAPSVKPTPDGKARGITEEDAKGVVGL